jgi:hypothetical protein
MFIYSFISLLVGLSMGWRGAGMPIFWHRPAPLRVGKIAPANRTKWGEPVRCGVMRCGGVRVVRVYAGLIPRYIRNQTKVRFSQEPNKKIRFKQITKARFKQITKKDERSEGNHSIPVLKRALTKFPPFPVSSSTLIWSFMTSPQDWQLG